ncbi:MAG: hypothetical protein ACPGUV_07130 [Polyangiales bacterium]
MKAWLPLAVATSLAWPCVAAAQRSPSRPPSARPPPLWRPTLPPPDRASGSPAAPSRPRRSTRPPAAVLAAQAELPPADAERAALDAALRRIGALSTPRAQRRALVRLWGRRPSWRLRQEGMWRLWPLDALRPPSARIARQRCVQGARWLRHTRLAAQRRPDPAELWHQARCAARIPRARLLETLPAVLGPGPDVAAAWQAVLLALGREAVAESAWQVAAAWLEAGCQRLSAASLLWRHRGWLELAQGHSAAAVRPLRRAWQLDPSAPDAALDLGRALLFSGAALAALRHLQHAAARLPTEPQLRLLGAQAGLEAGKPKQAARLVRPLLSGTGPLAAQAWQKLGMAAQMAGDKTSAQRAFRQALRRDPGLLLARMGLGAGG